MAASSRNIVPLLPAATNASITGVRATSTASGLLGVPKVAVTGVRATSTAAGAVGTLTTAPNSADFELGVDGATISTSDAGSVTAWGNVAIGTSTTVVYDDTHALETMAAKFATGGTSASVSLRWTTSHPSLTDHYGRIYAYFTAFPAASVRVIRIQDTAGTGLCGFIVVSPIGQLLGSDTSSASWGGVTTPIALNQWVRIEYRIIHSTTVGQMVIKLFNSADSTTLTDSATSAASLNTLTEAGEARFGVTANVANVVDFWLDEIMAAAPAYPGPRAVTVSVTGVRATATASAQVGTPKVAVTGVRATATAAGQAGAPKVAVTGARATATAAGQAGTPRIQVSGVRAAATASGRAGTVTSPDNVTISGVRATATASGRAGTVAAAGNVNISGVRAAATASGRAGTPVIAVSGVRATATASGRAGAVTTSGNATITGVRASATAAGRAGTPTIAVTGARATATASGRAGVPRVAVTGTRATATATGRTGTPWIRVTGVRSTATASGRAGTVAVGVFVFISGARATVTAAGRAGSVTATRNVSLTGVRAGGTAAGRTGTPWLRVTGQRASSTASCPAGFVRISVNGTRATVTASGRAGSLFGIAITLDDIAAGQIGHGINGRPRDAVVLTGQTSQAGVGHIDKADRGFIAAGIGGEV